MSDEPKFTELPLDDQPVGDENRFSAPPESQIRIQLDDSQIQASYVNLCFVSSTAEEVILDLALNKNPFNQPGDHKVKLSQRVVMSPYTAKRLASLLTSSVQRHEQQFGALEIDARKRMQQPTEGR